MPSVSNDPAHWHKRAEEMRAVAAEMNDEDSKEAMLKISRDYDRLAERILARLKQTDR